MDLKTEVWVLIAVLEVCKTVYVLKKLYQVSLSRKQALLFSRVQSSKDLLRSGSHELTATTSYVLAGWES